MQSINILLVEDDVTSQLILKRLLSDFEVTVAGTGEEGVVQAAQLPDLIILDINLPGIDGYETCMRIRSNSQTASIPIIFLSSYSTLDDRLEAYGVGGNDYITKPYDLIELRTKIIKFATAIEQQRQIDGALQNSHGLLMEVQTSAAKLQSISRFIQATLFCHDIDALFHHFFKTAREIDAPCVLQIHRTGGSETRSSDGEITKLEREILDMSSNMTRIYSFGKDRAIFHWKHATLLTRKVGGMIDTLAIFMDALEAGIRSVEAESKLLLQIAELETQSNQVRNHVTELFGEMNHALRDAILSLGLVSALDIEDEDRLTSLVETYGKRIDAELQALKENNHLLQGLVTELRTPPPELEALMAIGGEADDAITLF